MRLESVPAERIPELLPMRDAAEAMLLAFAALSAGDVVAPHRMHLPAQGSEKGSSVEARVTSPKAACGCPALPRGQG